MDPIALNAYINRFSRQLIDLDEQHDATTINYQSALDTLRRNRRRDVRGLSSRMADTGMTHSGIGMGENMNMNENYNRRQDGLASNKANRLSQIARRRLETESDLNEVRSYA